MPENFAHEREEFLRHFPVSHETLAKLDRYAELLGEWNAKFNLVSENSLAHVWQRHFLDSAQLMKFIPSSLIPFSPGTRDEGRAGSRLPPATGNKRNEGKKFVVADLGSGAGFPGLVLAIMGASGVHLIESIGKKANFLRAVVKELKLDAVIDHMRVEDSKLKADVVTARALKPLPELLKLAKSLMHKDSLCVLLKGQKIDAELTESAGYWRFEAETFPSLSDSSGRILIIRNLGKRAKGNDHGRPGPRKRR